MFTIDDGPHPTRTPAMLAALAEECTRVTFFSTGRMASLSPGILQDMTRWGHNVASHTHTHEYFNQISTERQTWQIDEADRTMRGILNQIGEDIQPFFRFPGGNESEFGLRTLQQRNIASFTWEAGADDWLAISAEEALRRALSQIEAAQGGLFLIHDTQQKSVDMLPHLLDELAKRGYKIVQIKAK